MNIVAFSINPLFPDRVMGGAPKHLQNIAIYLGELGHRVRVYCTSVSDSSATFNWHENVSIHLILRFSNRFPTL
ncbi:MAG: hypothetical protein R3C44_06945 [Chloroflexota bacterium]